MKSSFVALIAAAGLVGGIASAQAADLGGDCCADLEERVAELEATTARKGNRKVKLTVSGQVNEQILFWDDGVETNAYITTNEISRTRFRFVGDAKINADWSAGYLLEIGVRAPRGNTNNQNTDDGAAAALDIRHSAWWIANKQLGKVWLGQTSTASDGITEIDLSGRGHFITPGLADYNGGFFLRNTNGATANVTYAGIYSSNAPGAPGEGNRNNVVKYETPTIQGFALSAAWGEDDMWDVALRYAGEMSGFKLAAGIAYQAWSDGQAEYGCADLNGATSGGADCNALGLSASIMHVQTGLFVTGAYGYRNDDNADALFGANVDDTNEFWYLSAGIQQNWFGIGKSTVYGEYGQYDNGAAVTAAGLVPGATGLTGAAAGDRISSSEIEMWGLGFNQSIDAAAMDLYIGYRNIKADVFTSATGAAAGQTKRNVEDFQAVTVGGIIRF